ncbi:hypothetical protein [Paenibacillus sp. QZ-Y1]|uniref:hypothetical protein n=1 Tax=Paenibacillus sp. QZ-Y1 TaxID=3414511 RepID=UPI003F792DC0
MNATKELLSGLPFFKRCVIKVLTKCFFVKIVINYQHRGSDNPKAAKIKNFKKYIENLKNNGTSKYDAIEIIQSRLERDRIEFSDIPRLVFDIYDGTS